MIYKYAIFYLFLLPISTLSMVECKDRDIKKLQELNDDYEFKLLKLSSIGKMIQEKEELIESLTSKISALRADEEVNGFKQAINDFEKHVNTALMGDEGSIRLLTKMYILKKDNNDIINKIETGLIQISIERLIWKYLIEDYKKYLLELFTINQELK